MGALLIWFAVIMFCLLMMALKGLICLCEYFSKMGAKRK